MNRREFIVTSGGLASSALLAGCSSGGSGSTTTTGEGSTTTGGGDTTTSSGEEGEGTVKIGVLLPFSGTYSWVGANVQPVVEMIAEEINGQGGIGGREVTIVTGDTEGSPDASLSATKKLINVEGVSGIIGPTSITISAVYDQFTQNEVPIVTPTAGTTSLNDRGGEYVFRTVASDSLGGRAIAKAARNEKYNGKQDYSRMAMMVGNKEVFQSFKTPVKSSFEEFGGTVTTAMDINTGKASYQSEVQQIIGSDPELTVLIASNEDSVKILRAAFQAGYEGNWFVTQDQTNQEFLAQTESKVTDGILGLQAAAYQPAKEAGRLSAFQERIKEYAGWSESKIFARNTYDAMNVMGLAMKQTAAAGSEPTGTNIAAEIPKVARPPEQKVTDYTEGAGAIEDDTDIDYEGLVGPINFDENGDIVAPFSILTADDKSWNEVSILPPEALK